MQRWHRYWLYFVISYSLLHITRDIFQDLGVKNLLSTSFVKSTPLKMPILWVVLNTYVIALVEIVLSCVCLKRNKFEKIGYLTVCIAISIFSIWTFYWLFL